MFSRRAATQIKRCACISLRFCIATKRRTFAMSSAFNGVSWMHKGSSTSKSQSELVPSRSSEACTSMTDPKTAHPQSNKSGTNVIVQRSTNTIGTGTSTSVVIAAR
eukprot:CAMPEP_0176020684 /NCGR_PEP_ID=MMETSP0120_2-20121206/10027_1 /TAXON_ID=160619 /ORGANISM="Kryptoperidinium foliaceum, Strain CCMP 1326" /LENGTH=105 /DNA_ID=CAMNT_0017353787 /DNA_START=731 /DNA_END=1045 /DNA_ORIENTATION=+